MKTTPRTSEKLIINKSGGSKNTKATDEENVIKDDNISDYVISNYISNFKDIPKGNFTVFDLTGNMISSFEGIGRFPNLQKLILKDTLISSFKDACPMKSLTELNITNTPVNRRFFVREMALFALGFQLEIINGQAVNQVEQNLSTLNNRVRIESSIRNGNFLISYPNSESTNFTSSNFGFSSSISAKELTEAIDQFNAKFPVNFDNKSHDHTLNDIIKANSNDISYDQMANDMNRTVSAIKSFRNQQNSQQRWFSLENTRFSSADNEIANMRLQIAGLKPSISKSAKLSHYLMAQKENEAVIKSLEKEIANQQMLIEKIKACLHLSTELNFNIQFMIKDAKDSKLHFPDDEIQTMQNKINELTSKVSIEQIENQKLNSELKLSGYRIGHHSQRKLKLDQALNDLLQSNEKRQSEIDKLKIELAVLDDEENELQKQFEQIENEIKEINANKNEIDERIEHNKKEFEERIKNIEDL